MHLHEYQSKSLMREFGISNILNGLVVHDKSEIGPVIDRAFSASSIVVIKAQVHAGGRGKAGGVKVCKSVDEAKEYASCILGTKLITKQTSSEGQLVSALYCESGCNIQKEFYLSILIDRPSKCISIIISTEGGMDIEEVANSTPERIHTINVDISSGYMPFQTRKILYFLQLDFLKYFKKLHHLMEKLYDFFVQKDLSLLEINPLVLTKGIKDDSGDFIVLDAKVEIDENSAFRQERLFILRDKTQEEELEAKAKDRNLSYIKLDGSIGCMVNGAGLAMATMDIIQFYGERPANFLDVGGGASAGGVKTALSIILDDENVKAVLINIFGGIVQCDMIANSIVEAGKSLIEEGKKIPPMVVRLSGTNAKIGLDIIANSGLSFITAVDLDDASQKVVKSIRG